MCVCVLCLLHQPRYCPQLTPTPCKPQELFLARVLGAFVFSRELGYFTAQMAMLGLVYHTDPTATLPPACCCPALRMQNSGLMLYSRYPITWRQSKRFRLSGERLNSKGFDIAAVSVPGSASPLHVVNTHLDSRKWKHKKAQLDEIGGAVAELPPGPVVVTGDFNVCSSYERSAYQYLCDAVGLRRQLWDVFGKPTDGSHRQTPPKRSLFMQQFTCGAFKPKWPRSYNLAAQISLDHMLVGFKSPGRGSGGDGDSGDGSSQYVSVVRRALVDWCNPSTGEFVSDHLGLDVVLRLAGPR